MKNFRPYPEPEEYLDLEEMILTEEDEDLYQEIEDEIVGEELEGYWEDDEGNLHPIIRINQPPIQYSWPTYSYDCCENCSNNPKNGGSGVCFCTLPYYMNQSTVSIPSVWTSDQITLDSVTTTAQSYWEEE